MNAIFDVILSSFTHQMFLYISKRERGSFLCICQFWTYCCRRDDFREDFKGKITQKYRFWTKKILKTLCSHSALTALVSNPRTSTQSPYFAASMLTTGQSDFVEGICKSYSQIQNSYFLTHYWIFFNFKHKKWQIFY